MKAKHGKSYPKLDPAIVILQEAYKDATEEDIYTVEGVDSATGKSYTTDYRDLASGKDTIRQAVDRCNKRSKRAHSSSITTSPSPNTWYESTLASASMPKDET
jgi:hypothetical protein